MSKNKRSGCFGLLSTLFFILGVFGFIYQLLVKEGRVDENGDYSSFDDVLMTFVIIMGVGLLFYIIDYFLYRKENH